MACFCNSMITAFATTATQDESSIGIEEVELSQFPNRNPIPSSTLQMLTNAIRGAHNLQVLRLGVIHDPNQILRALAQAIVGHPSLRVLAIDRCEDDTSDDTAKLFLVALESTNVVLEELYLPRYYGKWLPKMKLYLHLNHSGIRRFLLNDTENNRGDYVKELSKISSDLDCAFFLIRSQPSVYFT